MLQQTRLGHGALTLLNYRTLDE